MIVVVSGQSCGEHPNGLSRTIIKIVIISQVARDDLQPVEYI
jgi:hypothetical protein